MRKEEIYALLKAQYDYIPKYEAIKWVLAINEHTKLKDILTVWGELYAD